MPDQEETPQAMTDDVNVMNDPQPEPATAEAPAPPTRQPRPIGPFGKLNNEGIEIINATTIAQAHTVTHIGIDAHSYDSMMNEFECPIWEMFFDYNNESQSWIASSSFGQFLNEFHRFMQVMLPQMEFDLSSELVKQYLEKYLDLVEAPEMINLSSARG